MNESERALGVIAPSLTALIIELKGMYERAYDYIRRGAPVFVDDFAISESFWEQLYVEAE